MKKTIGIIYAALLLCMAVATIVERYHGSDYVAANIYGAWWFVALWVLLVATGTAYFLRRKVRRASAVCLHLSLVVILAGAFLTYISGERGMIHLRQGDDVSMYFVKKGADGTEERRLPYSIRLDSFSVSYHEGTMAASDYGSAFTITDGQSTAHGAVSMNNIYSYRGVRFYQSSFDEDMKGSILAINRDPWGIGVTYTGYALLFISLLWMLIDPRGAYRQLLRSDAVRRGLLTVAVLAGTSLCANAAPVLPKETAETFCKLQILYNDRICPMQTLAKDFTKKMHGSDSYHGYTAEQVLTGFIFYGEQWSAEPIVKVGNALRERLNLPQYVSVNAFFSGYSGGYIIGPYLREYYQGNRDKFHKQVASADNMLQLVMQLRQGTLLKVFPVEHGGKVKWYAPTDRIDSTVAESGQAVYINNVFSLLYQEILSGNYGGADSIIGKMCKYQRQNGGASMPSERQIGAERLYNAVPFATILFMVNLTMGFLSLFVVIARLSGKSDKRNTAFKIFHAVAVAVMSASEIALTVCLALRWIISGNVPMGNGYETMLMVAWVVMMLSLLLCHKARIVLMFGFLVSGFALLVSHINQMDPQISQLMPVLNSPLLCMHVSVIMVSFALLSLTFVCGLTALGIAATHRGHASHTARAQMESLQALSRLFLYPALAALGIGIFVGAIWANVSWGTYWSWDSKEVWALIVFMVYAILLHDKSVPALSKPVWFHVYCVAAFLTVLMTYFGVNYLLTGMHSYA